MYHKCGTRSEVRDSRVKNGLNYRRRYCPKCDIRFTTYEISEEDYKKIKVIVSACKDLVIQVDDLDELEELDIKFRA